MNLRELQRNWNELGRVDPMWAVLSDPSKLGRHWNPAEFFETGEREIETIMETVSERFTGFRRGSALDFGCGLGRLSRALSSRFETVTGVDIAPSMIEQAGEFNRDILNCRFMLNQADDLQQFEDGSFDFVYTDIVLQHMHPRFAESYIREFVRVATPGGLIVFRMPDRRPIRITKWLKSAIVPLIPHIPAVFANAYLHHHYPNASDDDLGMVQQHPMELHGSPKSRVIHLLQQSGAQVAHIEEDVGEGWRSFRYFAQRH